MVDFLKTKDDYNCFIGGDNGRASKSKKLDFENWYIRKLIGQGAYGKVYLVTHKTIVGKSKHVSKDYALKIYKKGLLISNGLIEQTFKERDILLEMNHPFICNMY